MKKEIILFISLISLLSGCLKEESNVEDLIYEEGGKMQYPKGYFKEKIDSIDDPRVSDCHIFVDLEKNEQGKSVDLSNAYINDVVFKLSTWHYNSIFYHGLGCPADPAYKDLNQGAGGKYIYLYYGSSNNSGITNFWVTFGASNQSGSTCVDGDNTFLPADLNAGAGGSYVWANQSVNPVLSGGKYMNGIGVIMGNSSAISAPAGWTKLSGDLNKGAGGKYIYFIVKYRYHY